ncbi:hypothetical protein [Dietzia sp. 179-F 9C3 NHS]|uniref:hypothetical protein n=1 Tax=Dietzia sp. 179-F 9C3 NHS TaxID=3374295 RepID=UPI00387A0D6A
MTSYSARVFNPVEPDREAATYTVLDGFPSVDAAWQAVQDFLGSDERWSSDALVHQQAVAAARLAPFVAYDLRTRADQAAGEHPVSARVFNAGS